jgi:hypothetical protein
MILTELELELIEKYKDRLRTAKSNYVRNVIHIDMLKLVDIYNKITNTNYKLNGNCSMCQLNFFKAFAVAYDKYNESLVQKELEHITDNQEVIGNTDTNNNKKKKKTKKI